MTGPADFFGCRFETRSVPFSAKPTFLPISIWIAALAPSAARFPTSAGIVVKASGRRTDSPPDGRFADQSSKVDSGETGSETSGSEFCLTLIDHAAQRSVAGSERAKTPKSLKSEGLVSQAGARDLEDHDALFAWAHPAYRDHFGREP